MKTLAFFIKCKNNTEAIILAERLEADSEFIPDIRASDTIIISIEPMLRECDCTEDDLLDSLARVVDDVCSTYEFEGSPSITKGKHNFNEEEEPQLTTFNEIQVHDFKIEGVVNEYLKLIVIVYHLIRDASYIMVIDVLTYLVSRVLHKMTPALWDELGNQCEIQTISDVYKRLT